MKKILAIIIGIIISYFGAKYVGKNVFLANSPKLNPFYLSNLQRQINDSVKEVKTTLANLFKSSNNMESPSIATNINTNEIPDNFFKSISSGVSAYEKNDKETILRIKKGTKYKIKEIEINGVKYKAIDLSE